MAPRRHKRREDLGLTDEQYATLLALQGGTCALCPATPKARRLNTDHDHATGKVRGLLCHRCNRALPAWIRVGWLERAIAYLLAPPASEEYAARVTERCAYCGIPGGTVCAAHRDLPAAEATP